MTTAELKRSIARMPKEPGIYIFKSSSDAPLYIGKAGDLKSRVSAYLKVTDARLRTMVQSAKKVTFTRTDSDIEALLAESQLIKKHRPRFNIMMRDDKQYFYVAITKDPLPKIFITHRPVGDAEYIGPFTDGTALKTALKLLRTIFPYCTCTQKHYLLCLNAHLDMCPGFCCLKQQNPKLKVESERLKVQKKEYARNIRAIRDILNGKRASLITDLERRMKTLGQRHQLLEARELQRRIAKLKRVFENARINARNQRLIGHSGAPSRVEGYDVAAIQGQYAVGAMAVFADGMPDKNEYRLFNIKTAGGDTDMLREILKRRMKHKEWPLPDLIVVDGGKAQFNVVRKAFGSRIRIVALAKDKHHRGIKIIEKERGKFRERLLSAMPPQERNLIVHADGEAHRFAIRYHRHLHGRTLLTGRRD